MKIKRFCAAALAVTMSITALAGCGKKQDGTTGSKTDHTTAAGETSGSGEAAMGRYMESEIPLPGEDSMTEDRKLKLVSRDDGQVFLYAAKVDYDTLLFDVLCYAWTGDGWEETKSGLHQANADMGNNGYLDIITIQQFADGTEYLTCLNWSSYNEDDMTIESYIIKAGPEGGAAAYTTEPLVTVHGIDYAHIFSDGSILASLSSKANLYDPDGISKREFLQGFCPNNVRTLVTAGNMEYITATPEDTNLVRYNIETGEVMETIPIIKPETAYSHEGNLTMDQDGNIFLCNAGGIHYWKKGGSIWETLADGNLNSLSMPGLSVMGMVLGYDDDYLVLASESGGGPSILRYDFQADVASVPSETLSIFGLEDNATVRQAIAQYQKQNPDIRVDYQVGDGGDGGAAITDIIKALNTELLNKKGADILILDGLPVEDYIEKGVLADISNLVAPMIENGTLLEQAAGSSGHTDGSVYSVPARFQFPIMYGTPEGMAAMQSLASIRDYDGSLPLLRNRNYGEVLKLLMNIYHAELFGDGEMISKENLVLLLEAAKAMHDRGLDPNLEAMSYAEEKYNLQTEYGMDPGDSILLFSGAAAMTAETIESVQSIMFPGEIMRQLGVEPTTANGIYFPTMVVGINDSSSRKEQAQEFITLLLSEEIQSARLHDGFPINRAAFESWRTYRDDDSMISSSIVEDDGSYLDIEATWPAEEMQSSIFALQKDMVTPVMADRVLTEMIIDEANAYFEGTTDAAGAADAIGNRAAMYLLE